MLPPRAPVHGRLVLQTGASTAVGELFAVTFSFGAVVSALLVGGLVAADALPFPHKVVLPLVPVLFAGSVVFFHWLAWRSRASDLHVGEQGVAVVGGPRAGDAWTWEQIDLARTRTEEDPSTTLTVNGHVTVQRKLLSGLVGRGETTLGASLDDAEQESFEAVVTALRAVAEPPRPPVPPRPERAGPAVLRCPACAAPTAPVADARARCWRCDAEVPVPDDVQARVAAAARLDGTRPALDAAVRHIRDQPGATEVNRLLLGLAASKYALPLLLLVAPGYWLATVGGVWALSRLAALRIATRRAYPRLTWRFGAHPPVEPGAPLMCRSCGGALPAPRDGAAVERCPWCDADNVLGIDLVAAAGDAAAASADLERFLAEQRARRAWPLLQLVAALALAAWGVVSGLRGG